MSGIIVTVILVSAVSGIVIYLTEKMPCAVIVRFLCALCICLSVLIPLKSVLPEFKSFSDSLIEPGSIQQGSFENDFADTLKGSLEKSAAEILLYRFGTQTRITAELDTADMTNIRIVALRVHFFDADLIQKAECLASLRTEFLCEVTEE